MKSKTLRQIEKNKRAYYLKIAQVKNDSPAISASLENYSTQNNKTKYDFKNSIPFSFKKISFKPKFNFSFANKVGSKVVQIAQNGLTKMNLLNNGINQYINSKTDKVIDRFYELGTSVFEDNNTQNDEMHFQANPLPSNIAATEMLLHLPATPIVDEIKKIIKSIVIYFESDFFSFSNIKPTSKEEKSRIINYQDAQEKNDFAVFELIKKTTRKVEKAIQENKKHFFEISLLVKDHHIAKKLIPKVNRFIKATTRQT